MQNFQQNYAPQGFQRQQHQDNHRADNLSQRRSQSFGTHILNFMGENERLLNIHEQQFAELAAFQADIIVFQANSNAFLKNLET